MSDFLTKEDILAADDLPFEDVIVPEWGGKKVRVIGLNAKDAQEYSSRLVSVDSKGRVQKMHLEHVITDLLVRTLVDESNRPLFGAGELDALGKKSAVVLTRLSEIAQRLSGMGDEAKQAVKENLA